MVPTPRERTSLANQRGSVTVEAALALAVLVTVAAAIVAGIATLASYISAVDIAGAAARAHAIGVDFAPPRGEVTVEERDGLVTVTARVPAPIRPMSATAIFPVEQR